MLEKIQFLAPDDFFFPIADLKNFSSCDVIQQIKKTGLDHSTSVTEL